MNQPTDKTRTQPTTPLLSALVLFLLPALLALGLPCPASGRAPDTETTDDSETTLQALSPDKEVLYILEDNQLQARRPAEGSVVTLELPPNFPRFSWPSGVAYDSRRDLVSVVSYGGDGCWYRYDVKAGRWLDFRSLNGLDLVALTYDAKTDSYTARTTLGRNSLLVVSGDLNSLSERPLPGKAEDGDEHEPEAIRFGPPVAAEYPSAADGLTALSDEDPPRNLAHGAEIVVLTGYEPPEAEQRGTKVRVTLDRPGKRVLLVLAAYETVHWQVTVKPGTSLAGILAAGYHRPFVSLETAATVPAYRINSNLAGDSRDAAAWTAEMQRRFGVDRVDVFRADYTLPSEFLIDRLDASKPGSKRTPKRDIQSEPI